MNMKLKNKLSKMGGYAVLALIIFTVAFSTGDDGGYGFTIGGMGWLNSIGNLLENFIFLFNIMYIVIAALFVLLTFLYHTEASYREKVLEALLEVHDDILTVLKETSFKKWRFFLVSLPIWFYIIGAGWAFTGFFMIAASVTFMVYQKSINDHLRKTHVVEDTNGENDEDNEKSTVLRTLSKSDL